MIELKDLHNTYSNEPLPMDEECMNTLNEDQNEKQNSQPEYFNIFAIGFIKAKDYISSFIHLFKSKITCFNFVSSMEYNRLDHYLPKSFRRVFNFLKTEKGQFYKRWTMNAILLLIVVFGMIYLCIQNYRKAVNVFGLIVLILFSYCLSTNQKRVNWTISIWGFSFQFFFGLLVLYTKFGYVIFDSIGQAFSAILELSNVGAKFVFGEKFEEHFFAFKVLPIIIYLSAIVSVLYYFGILPKLVKIIAWIMTKTMETSGAESMSCSANIFLGQTEAPLLIKPFISTMTMSELHTVMAGGFATISGSVMGAYINLGVSATHLLSASVMNAPAAIAMSKIIFPETEEPLTKGKVEIKVEQNSINVLDAITQGAAAGGKLALNVAVMLIAYLSLVGLCNSIMLWIGKLIGLPFLSLDFILSYLFSPLAFLLGITNWNDCLLAGQLLGQKTILNEFVAYISLQDMVKNNLIGKRAEIISTYALCGFSNLGSIGVQIGALSVMAPERQNDLVKVSVRALIAGSLACFMTANIASLLID